MIKRKEETESDDHAKKKFKKQLPNGERQSKKPFFEKTAKFAYKSKARKSFSKAKNNGNALTEKPESWVDFKKSKKELRIKRKQSKTGFDVIIKAKKIGERLRCKTLKGGEVERNKLINELHSLLKGQSHYAKFVVAHDTSRVVQWLLKYSSEIVKNQISQELIPATLDMLQSKYGTFCIKRLLKYGNSETRSAIIKKMYGRAVKLSSHVLSAPIFEYAYTTWATTQQKHHFIQEFFGDMYKNSKDNEITHLRDVFTQSPGLKTATLSATKANLLRVINKNLLDSALVQTVLSQYLSECTDEDRAEIISQVVPHIVIISNSKNGARAAMQCIWHGTNKNRKLTMKVIKEHAVELAKHEHGHCTIIALLDAADDTVLLNKIVLSELLKGVHELALNDWGRKVLMWLVAPADPTCFHPAFVKELEEGRRTASVKKDAETRRKEILDYSIDALLAVIIDKPEFWLGNSSLAYEMLSIVKTGSGDERTKALTSIVKVIVGADWKIKSGDQEVLGIENPGIHMVLNKLAKHDQSIQDEHLKFGVCLVEYLTDDVLTNWLLLNRGCFLLITVYENSSIEVQTIVRQKLQNHQPLLKSQNTAGSKILLEKLK